MAGKLGRALVLLVLLAAALITQAPLAVFLLAFALVLLVLLRLDAAYLRRQVTAELLVPDKPVIQGEDYPDGSAAQPQPVAHPCACGAAERRR